MNSLTTVVGILPLLRRYPNGSYVVEDVLSPDKACRGGGGSSIGAGGYWEEGEIILGSHCSEPRSAISTPYLPLNRSPRSQRIANCAGAVNSMAQVRNPGAAHRSCTSGAPRWGPRRSVYGCMLPRKACTRHSSYPTDSDQVEVHRDAWSSRPALLRSFV